MPIRARRTLLGPTVVIALLLPLSAGAQSEPPPASPTPLIDLLDWKLVDVMQPDGVRPSIRGDAAGLRFLEGKLTAWADCFTAHAAYTLDDPGITIGDLEYDGSSCGERDDWQRQAVVDGLLAATTYELGPGTLTILDGTGTSGLDLMQDDWLEGRDWTLVSPGDQGGPAKRPTILFQGGQVSGVAYCNWYAADYAMDGSSLMVGGFDGAHDACPDLDRETAYLDVLSHVAAWRHHGDSLTLLDENGEPLLAFLPPLLAEAGPEPSGGEYD
ncbi:MAG: META domain-containing protein [Chloroflexota bacterium]